MSREERASNGKPYCLLPEMVTSATKDVYFFSEDKQKDHHLVTKMRQTRLEETSSLTADGVFEWTEFKLSTYKTGAYGPSKSECIDYYSVE